MNPNIEKAFHDYEALIAKENKPAAFYNGIYTRYENPVLTRDHIPPFWKFDLNEETNPLGLERLGVNAVMNSGAIKLNGQYCLVARVEGNDRKSFFAVARSNNPVQGFRFDDYPVILPDTSPEETNWRTCRALPAAAHHSAWKKALPVHAPPVRNAIRKKKRKSTRKETV